MRLANYYVCHSLRSPPRSDPEESVAALESELESELESDDPEPPRAFRAFRAFRLAARSSTRAARRGVTANGSATAAAETAASRERLGLDRFERRFSTPSPRRANVAAAHPHEATTRATLPGNHASVWHVSQKALRVCLLGAMAGQRARAISNAARQDRED